MKPYPTSATTTAAPRKWASASRGTTYIPYTDRIDYLGGVMNNLPYVMAVEKLAGIEVPDRAQVIRIMLAELFRISSHLVFYGTFAQDVGQMSPVFYMFIDRERLLTIIEAITGGRMHPSWFRIGGVAQDLPEGWDVMVRDFIDYLPARLDHYDKMSCRTAFCKQRTIDIGPVRHPRPSSGGSPGRDCAPPGCDWDLRKKRPYGGYDQFEFDVPTGSEGRRLLRPLRGARGGDSPEPQDHPPVPGQHAERALQGRPPAAPRRRPKSARCRTSRRSFSTF